MMAYSIHKAIILPSLFLLSLLLLTQSVFVSSYDLAKIKDNSDNYLNSEGNKILIQAGGATFPNSFYQDALFGYRFVNTSVELSYVSMGSSSGKCRIMDYEIKCKTPFNSIDGTDVTEPIYFDFAGSDSILTPSEYTAFSDIQMYPAVAGAVVPIFNIPNFPTNENLILSPSILARIFRKCISDTARNNGNCGSQKNDITRWDNADIIQLNQNFGASTAAITALQNAGEIKVVVREDGSGTTEIFRDALSAFDTDFATQVGVGSSATWNFVDIIKAPGNEGVTSYVLKNPGSIGYSVLGEVMHLGMQYASLTTGASTYVVATPEAVTYTALELGMQFGNNNDTFEHLTAKLINSKGFKTWPICGYSYFVLRKNTLRPGATCETRKATLDFLTWIYTSSVAAQLAAKHGFSALPSTVADYVLTQMRSQLLCPTTGKLVYVEQADSRSQVKLYGDKELGDNAIDLFASTYSKTVRLNALVSYNRNVESVNGLMNSDITSFVPYPLLEDANLKGTENFIQLPYAGVGFVVITNFCGVSVDQCLNPGVSSVKLTPTTLARILMKDITNWNMTGNLNLPGKDIKVFFAPTSNSLLSQLSTIIANYHPTWNLQQAIIKADETFSSVDNTIAAVRNIPYSIAVVPFIGNNVGFETLIPISILDASDTNYITPSVSNIKSCLGSDTWDNTLLNFNIEKSKKSGCYPLSVAISVKSKKAYTNSPSDSLETAKFLQWLFNSELSTPLIEQNVAPLWTEDILTSIGKTSSQLITNALYSITNDGASLLKPKSVNLNLINDGAVIAGMVLCFICIFVCLCFSFWLHRNVRTRVVRLSSPPFMHQITFGSILCILTIVPLGIQDGGPMNATGAQLDAACASIPFLFSMGACITHGALMLKTWRISKIFNNPKLQKVYLPDKKLLQYEIIFLTIVLIVNIVWCATTPLHWERHAILYSDDGTVIASVGGCQSENSTVFLVILAALIGASLIFGNYLAYATRNVPDEFAEGKWIAISLMVMLEALLLGIPVIVISSTDPTASFIVTFMCILIMSMGTVLFLYVPKVLLVMHNEAAKRTSNESDENKKKTPLGASDQPIRDSTRASRPVPVDGDSGRGMMIQERVLQKKATVMTSDDDVDNLQGSSMKTNLPGTDVLSFGVYVAPGEEANANKSKSTLTVV